MNTTIREIIKYSPCYSDEKMDDLIKEIGIDTEISFKQILDRVGIEDAVWCLRVLDYKEICLFCADLAESVLYIFEEKYPNDKRPREAIEGIRKYQSDGITIQDLEKLRADAVDAAAAAAAYAVAATYATATAAAYAAAAAAAYAVAAAAYATATAAAAADRQKQWKKTEELFIKYFCEDK